MPDGRLSATLSTKPRSGYPGDIFSAAISARIVHGGGQQPAEDKAVSGDTAMSAGRSRIGGVDGLLANFSKTL